MSGTTFQPTDRSYISLLEIFYGSKQYVDNQYIKVDNSTISIDTNGALKANYSYGTTLPTTGTDGDIFFLYS